MKRKSRAELAVETSALIDRATPIVVLFRQRYAEEAEAKGGGTCMTAIVQDVLRTGIMPQSSNVDPLRMSARQRWLVNVAWVLAQLGPVGSAVLIARLTRNRKHSEASWDRIASDVSRVQRRVLLATEARLAFGHALPQFVMMLDNRGIDRNVEERSIAARTYVGIVGVHEAPSGPRVEVQPRSAADAPTMEGFSRMVRAVVRGRMRVKAAPRRTVAS